MGKSINRLSRMKTRNSSVLPITAAGDAGGGQLLPGHSDGKSQRPAWQARELQVRQIDEAKNTIRVKVASSKPLLRAGYWNPWYEQIALEQANMAFIESGNAPLLDGHDSRKQIGLIEDPALEPDGEYVNLVVTMRFFPEVPESMAAWEKVSSGFSRNVSIGWTRGTGDVDEITPSADNGLDYTLVIYREPEIIEVSLVAIPADTEVGIGREVSEDCIASIRSAIQTERGSHMPQPKDPKPGDEGKQPDEPEQREKKPTPEPEANPETEGKRKQPEAADETVEEKIPDRYDDSGQRWLADNETRLRTIGVDDASIKKLREAVDAEKSGSGISSTRVMEMSWEMIDGVEEQRGDIGKGGAPAAHTRDHDFDIGKVVRQMAKGQPIDGLEAEVIADFANSRKEWMPPSAGRGIIIPHSVLMRQPSAKAFVLGSLEGAAQRDARYIPKLEAAKRAYEVGSSPSGFFHEQLDENIFAAALVAQAKVLMKCSVLTEELVQDLATIRETGTVSTYWSTEKSTRAESTALPTYTNRTFQWHQINARADVQQRTLDQSRAFFGRLMDAMRRDIPRGINRSIIGGGTAIANDPTGILDFTGLDTVAIGTNGGQPTYQHLTELIGTVEGNNAMNPDGWCFAMTAAIKQNIYGQGKYSKRDVPIIERMGMMETINGYEVVTDNNIPSNLTKGTATDASAIIFGDFSNIEIAPFSGVELFVDPYTAQETSLVKVYMRQALDFLPKQVDNLAAIVDARNTTS